MRQMFQQFFSMISMFFSAGERIASASNHMATYLDQSAQSFAEQAEVERKRTLALALQDLKEVKRIK